MAPRTGPGRIRLAGRTVQLTWLREHSAEAAPLFAAPGPRSVTPGACAAALPCAW
ncbi:hypothetical protein AB0D98_19590 [Streptomyces sp. NPDC047987]|uniref:hypothetical protein n=1 Tax=unclassified Streptomyces TaxID=2593676 RepID=UPI0034250ABA